MLQETVAVVESGKAEVVVDDLDELLQARIPLNNNPRKMRYLGYRATGFSVRESCAMAEIHFATVLRWRREDEEFREYENHQIPILSQQLGADINRLEFMRNFRMFMRMDERVLKRALGGLLQLTDREFAYLQSARKHYNGTSMLAMAKALEPDLGERSPINVEKGVFMLPDGQEITDETGKRAAVRILLEQFIATEQAANAIEGEFEDKSGDDDTE